jgi:hypothetical protein
LTQNPRGRPRGNQLTSETRVLRQTLLYGCRNRRQIAV